MIFINVRYVLLSCITHTCLNTHTHTHTHTIPTNSQKSIDTSVCGQELHLAVLDYIRHNDMAVLEGCDKVLSKYQEELLTAESFAEFCDVMGKLAFMYTSGQYA